MSGLSDAFAAPRWLRDLGITAWLLVGVALALVGAVWLLSLTHVIVLPVIAAAVVASVTSPLVGWMSRHRVPRAVGAALVLLAIVALAIGLIVLVFTGIASQADHLKDNLGHAKDTISGWLKDIGFSSDKAKQATQDASSTSTNAVNGLLTGVAAGLEKLSSLVFFLAMTVLSLFFLLKDGPTIRTWGERHLGVNQTVARAVTTQSLRSLRDYFLGVTIVAGFNGVVVGAGALILGVPQAGSIFVVTFLGAYVPYLGAWTAGAFSVLLALGGAGTDAAIGMIVVQLLANSVLQQLVQPIAYGAALGINPLAVLIVTIAGGALFGAVGLILAAPVTSAITRISAELARAREEKEAEAEQASGAPGPEPSPA